MSRLLEIKRAIISVSDKTGLAELGRALTKEFGVEVISTGGTARVLAEAEIKVTDVSEFTGFPEIFGGRLKTLHPKVAGGILFDPSNEKMVHEAEKNGIIPIQMVVVNLYPFEKVAAQDGVPFDDVVEQIDIGGPTMLRAAAKNWKNVLAVHSPDQYGEVLNEMRANDGAVTTGFGRGRVSRVFLRTRDYDRAIHLFLEQSSS